jgi:PITH domain
MENNPPHVHHAGCGCAEEHKKTDPNGVDLYPYIDLQQVDCFNERTHSSIKNVIRPFEDKMNFTKGVTQSGYGKDLVVFIPFNGEIKIKAICVIGGEDGTAPS